MHNSLVYCQVLHCGFPKFSWVFLHAHLSFVFVAAQLHQPILRHLLRILLQVQHTALQGNVLRFFLVYNHCSFHS